ncbi:MAG: anti-sigma factor [Woeseiaceae bacterium]|nr:anti-sigma factor [Woeseiaceae bacterium]
MNDIHPDILELLVQRATEGLDREQTQRLQRLLSQHGLRDTDEFDLAAAAAANAFGIEQARGADDTPASLKARLRVDADNFFGTQEDKIVEFEPRRSGRRRMDWGWATAAALALALIATNLVNTDTATNFEAARDALLANSASTVTLPWATPEDPGYADVRGDVVWNDERQEGYMLLSGMPTNNPEISQYQLWLVDPERDSNPVDGGVFDIPPGESTIVIPINAKLAVKNPAAFAITREKPGGVVVSEGPLLVVASAG